MDTTKAYQIGSAAGRILAQVQGGSATTSLGAATGSALASWSFVADGDGSYQVVNSATGQLLGVDSTQTTDRAWGTTPTVTAAPAGGPSVGQQWFLVPSTTATGSFRLVNRYSGLVLGLSSNSSRLAETTPTRSWTDTTGSTVGGGRTAAEQTLTFTPTASSSLNGSHTLTASGMALDDPNHSTTAGTQLITWTPNGGGNQTWVFAQQSDGSYQITNGQSGLCMDDSGGSTRRRRPGDPVDLHGQQQPALDGDRGQRRLRHHLAAQRTGADHRLHLRRLAGHPAAGHRLGAAALDHRLTVTGGTPGALVLRPGHPVFPVSARYAPAGPAVPGDRCRKRTAAAVRRASSTAPATNPTRTAG